MATSCSIQGCLKPLLARGLCMMHYGRWYRTGTTEVRLRPTIDERFWAKVDCSGGTQACWLWTASLLGGGYGQFTVNRATRVAHRWLYEQIYGTVAQGLQLDHLCRNPACVNPSHLEPVTPAENTRRADIVFGIRSAATHCPADHSLIAGNLRADKRGRRSCLTCHRERARRVRAEVRRAA